jgi:hypothetical protein
MNEIDDGQKRIEERLAAAEKRFEDLKGYLGGAATLLTIWFAVLTIVLSVNYSSEKASLRDFQRDLREDLGKSAAAPDIKLFGIDGKPLDGQSVTATFEENEPGKFKINIDYVINNSGLGATGPMTTKLYTVNPIKLLQISTDESHFEYQAMIRATPNEPDEMQGGLSFERTDDFKLTGTGLPPSGKYPALLKVYYGKGKVAAASFNIVVTKVK